MENREFYIEHDGMRIHSKLDFPAGMTDETQKRPVFILVHGLTGHMEERHLLAVKDRMNSLGFVVLRVELYGHGKSDGDFRDHTVLKWVNQMTAVIDYAEKLSFANGLYLGGHSQGGLTSLLVGGIEADRIRALFLLSPAVIIRDAAREGNMLGYTFDPDHIPAAVGGDFGAELGGNYLRVARFLPVEETIDRYTGPVLVVHGDQDEAVPVHYAYLLAERYQNCTLHIIEGDTHCYDYHLDEACGAVEAFVRKMMS